jgi:hypothetical protein
MRSLTSVFGTDGAPRVNNGVTTKVGSSVDAVETTRAFITVGENAFGRAIGVTVPCAFKVVAVKTLAKARAYQRPIGVSPL